MKTKFFLRLMVCLIAGFISCNKEDDPGRYDGSKITVEVIGADSHEALVGMETKDVKDLGEFIAGVCYSTNKTPDITNEHYELSVDTDTLTEDDLVTFFIIEELNQSTDYYIRGYLKAGNEVYYSASKTFKTEANSLEVEVSYNYLPAGRECWFVVSDNSTTLLSQKIENGGSYYFTENIPDKADIHLFKWDPSSRKLYVESYTDIIADEFYLANPYYAFQSGTVSTTISDLSDFLSWGVSASWWWNTTTVASTKTLSTYILYSPDNLFIHYLPSDGSAPRYKVVEAATPGSEYSFTMADFTPMTQSVDINLPANNLFFYNLAGFNTDYYTEFRKYHSYTYNTGYQGTFKLYYPVGVNTSYYFYSLYNTSNTQSFYNKIGSLPSAFFLTFPEITITNSTHYTTTTSATPNYSSYEIMDFCGFYSTSGLYVQWDYYTKPQASNTVQIPDFPAQLKSQINNISTGDLSFSDVGYFDITEGEVDSYESYVDILVKESERFYDVIRERRYYFRWENKSAFESKAVREDMRIPSN